MLQNVVVIFCDDTFSSGEYVCLCREKISLYVV